MNSILIKDTTKEEREQIVAESIGNINGSCDGCMAGLADMYQDYIDGKKEIWSFVQHMSQEWKLLKKVIADINKWIRLLHSHQK